jgi:NitT/TauT family transport system ATP-binding protein
MATPTLSSEGTTPDLEREMSTQQSPPARDRSAGSGIEIVDLHKFYLKRGPRAGWRRTAHEHLHVLENIGLTIKPGEFVSLLGPSGCGKTTLLKCIDGLLPFDHGEIRVAGKPIKGPGRDRAFVFQNFGLLPWRTVLGNVTLPLEDGTTSKDEREELARHFIEMVGLTRFIDRHPHELSGGMQQRVGIARGLAMSPQILLMDEPFGALDAQTRELMQVELLQIWRDTGKTVVFVTHSVDEAIFLSQRIVVMSANPGRISEVLEVPFGYPRDDSIKMDPAYGEMRHRLWQMLSPRATAAFIE